MTKLLVFSSLCMEFGGGFQNWIMRTLPGLRRAYGHDILLVDSTYGTPRRVPASRIRSWAKTNGIAYKRLDVRSSIPVLGLRQFAQMQLMARSADLIYYDAAIASFDPCFATIALSRPVIAGWHAPLDFPNFLHRTYLFTGKRLIARLFPTHHVLNDSDRLLLTGFGCRNVHVIPLGLDVECWRPRSNKWDADTFRITFVGRLEWQKGFDIFVDTIQEFLREEREPHISVSILGTGSMIGLAKALSDPRCFLLGFVEDPVSVLSESHCVILPSRIEPFGNSILEAMSCGNVVLAYQNQGSNQLISDKHSGFIVSSRRELLDRLLWVYATYKRRRETLREIGVNARRSVQERFSIRRHLEQLNDLMMCAANR